MFLHYTYETPTSRLRWTWLNWIISPTNPEVTLDAFCFPVDGRSVCFDMFKSKDLSQIIKCLLKLWFPYQYLAVARPPGRLQASLACQEDWQRASSVCCWTCCLSGIIKDIQHHHGRMCLWWKCLCVSNNPAHPVSLNATARFWDWSTHLVKLPAPTPVADHRWRRTGA